MKIIERLFGRYLEREVRQRVDLAAAAYDDPRDWRLGGGGHVPRDRHASDRREVLAQALAAWRVNPLARRIVALTTQYVVGGGLRVEARHAATNAFLQAFWGHRLNRMSVRLYELCDELTRSGDLFLALSTDASGMSYLRAIPSADVAEIETAGNDLEQEVAVYEQSASLATPEGRAPLTPPEGGEWVRGRRWAVYDPATDHLQEDSSMAPVILHYAINRPVGGLWGESDLAPMLRWLARYANWLEDRARLNRYRNTFLFWVKAQYTSEGERLRRQAELNANPPSPGSILVTDQSEEWSTLNANLGSYEAGEDGLALKKMVAVGSGTPLHFLAEPESTTRTTAESSGGPTFRHYEQRQLFFLWLVEDLLRAVLRRRALVDRRVDPEAPLAVRGSEISARDNHSQASAASLALGAFKELHTQGLIDDRELLRVVYRFAGEVVDIEEMLRRRG